MKNNNKILIIIFIITIISLFLIFKNKLKPTETTLELGIFAGSNWNVTNEDYYKFIDNAIETFEKENPNVRVHYYSGIRKSDYSEWLCQRIIMGQTPDVMIVLSKDFNTLASLNVLKDLDELINDDSSIAYNDFFPFAISAGKFNNQQFGLPCEVNPRFMAINKTLLNQQGYSIPDKNWDWDEFYEICKGITNDLNDDGYLDIFGYCGYDWTDAVYSNGSTLFNQNGKNAFFNTKNFIESIKFMQKLNKLNNGKILTKDDFDSGKVAFMPLTFAEYKTYTTFPYKIEKYLNIEWEFTTMPQGPNGSNISKADTLLMAINNNTKHEKLAFELLKTFTTNKEIQFTIYEYAHGASPLKSAASSEIVQDILQQRMAENEMKYNRSLMIDILNKSIISPQFRKYDEVLALADQEITAIISEDKNADSSLKKFQRSIIQKLE